jgi:hypothetical protein
MAQKSSKPPPKQAPKVTVIRGKPAEAEMAAMERAAKAQAKAKGKR